MKISVIIPIYNASSSLRRCVESLLHQDFDSKEIILVDDGSFDDSAKICDEYERDYDNVIVIHQSNSGPSKARNAGIEIAQGEWIAFADSDDYVETCYLSSMVSCAEKYHADFVFSGFKYFVDSKYSYSVEYEECAFSTSNMSQLIGDLKIYRVGYPFCKRYKKAIIDKYNVRFDERVFIAEDLLFMEHYFIALNSVINNTIVSCSSTSYNYLLHSDSFSAKCTTYEK